MQRGGLYINPHQEPGGFFFFFFFPAFKEQPCAAPRAFVWVSACGCWGSQRCWLAWRSVILQVAHRLHLLLPVTNYPETPTPVKSIISWPKHWEQLVHYLSDSGRRLKQFEGNALTNCWFKRDHSGKATTIMGLLFISLYEAITISIVALYIIWLLSGLNYRMVFVGRIS